MKISRDTWAIIVVALICITLTLGVLTKWEIPKRELETKNTGVVGWYQARAEELKDQGLAHIEAYEQAAREQCEMMIEWDIKW